MKRHGAAGPAVTKQKRKVVDGTGAMLFDYNQAPPAARPTPAASRTVMTLRRIVWKAPTSPTDSMITFIDGPAEVTLPESLIRDQTEEPDVAFAA